MAPLVDYTDSDSEPDEPQPAPKRRKLGAGISASPVDKAVPAPPASFFSLYASNVRTSTADDPSLHGGRKRQVAHREGNWPTHVYLEWHPTEQEEHEIDVLINAASNSGPETHSFLRSSLGVQLPLHISLSAPLVLETEQRERFAESVKSAISNVGARSFAVKPTAAAWVSNFDKTRQFLVLKLTRPSNDDLNKLLCAANTCARELGLAELYQHSPTEQSSEAETKDDFFHVSVAWTLQDPTDTARDTLRLPPLLQETKISFDTVKLKIGNVVHDLVLARP